MANGTFDLTTPIPLKDVLKVGVIILAILGSYYLMREQVNATATRLSVVEDLATRTIEHSTRNLEREIAYTNESIRRLESSMLELNNHMKELTQKVNQMQLDVTTLKTTINNGSKRN